MHKIDIGSPQETLCRPLSEFEPRHIEWLWNGRIPIGCVTLLEGDGGTGKSFVAAAIASALSAGKPLPDDQSREPTNVLLIAAEDDPSVVLRPRCEAQGADLSKVFFFEANLVLDANGTERIQETAIITESKLIIIDPIVSFLGTKIDTSSATDVRSVMQPLADLAAELNIAILVIRHWNKSHQASASMRGSGSVDFRNGARSSLQVIKDGNDHYLTLEKSNYGAIGKTLKFEITEQKLNWTGTSELLADEILNRQRGVSSSSIREAEQFLKEVLALGAQPVSSLKEDAIAFGISDRTLERAKQNLGVMASKRDNRWYWSFGQSE